jgi:hypothetical protein
MKIMHTMASEARPKVPKRRYYSPELKLQIVGECGQTAPPIAAVALKYSVNVATVHRWLCERTSLLDPLKYPCSALPHSNTHGHHAVFQLVTLQRMDNGRRANGACSA